MRCGRRRVWTGSWSLPTPWTCSPQQITAEVAAREWVRGCVCSICSAAAHPYRDLSRRADFDDCVNMLAGEGSARAGGPPWGAAVSRQRHSEPAARERARPLRPSRPAARFPTTPDYKVVLEPEGFSVGSVNEDFAVESLQGDIFQLGNTSYRILRVGARHRAPWKTPTASRRRFPFWLGEAPGRSDELSAAGRAPFERRSGSVSTAIRPAGCAPGAPYAAGHRNG